jgi:hypothetical protein
MGQRVNCVLFGLLALLAAQQLLPAPRMARDDFLSDALWQGCKARALDNLTTIITKGMDR